jgi:signal transduction histidine kinase
MGLSGQPLEFIPRSGAIALNLLVLPIASLSALLLWLLVLVVLCTLLTVQRQKILNARLKDQLAARTRQLQASMGELEELSQLQDVLLYAISHDIRTTMIGSLMVLEHVQAPESRDERSGVVVVSRELLQRMTHSGKVQLDRLNRLLETHAHVTNGMVIQKQQIWVKEVLDGAIADLQLLLAENQTKFVHQFPSDLWVMADPSALRQVFYQMIANAVKHNSPGVEVRVEAKIEHAMLRFTVTDNGVGIDPLEQTQIFNLRLKPQQERQLTQISLGLCLCKQIVVAHGGEIGVSGDLGQGTSLWFTLPLSL